MFRKITDEITIEAHNRDTMKFYFQNPFTASKKLFTALNRRLSKNSAMIDEDHNAIVELKTTVVGLKAHVERLHLEVVELRSRQQALRNALVPLRSQAIRTDPAVDDND